MGAENRLKAAYLLPNLVFHDSKVQTVKAKEMTKGTIHIVICACIICVFLAADLLSSLFEPSAKVARCLLDTSCHATIAALIWLATLNLGKRSGIRFEDINKSSLLSISNLMHICGPYKEVAFSLACGSLVDLDHFIAAGSVSLADATNLQTRPLGHTVVAGVLTSLAVFMICLVYHTISQGGSVRITDTPAWYRSKRYALLVFSAYFAHLLRDSVRRGLWLGNIPGYFTTSGSAYVISSPPLSLWVVLTIFFIMPSFHQLILYRWKSQVKLAEYGDVNDNERGNGECKLTV